MCVNVYAYIFIYVCMYVCIYINVTKFLNRYLLYSKLSKQIPLMIVCKLVVGDQMCTCISICMRVYKCVKLSKQTASVVMGQPVVGVQMDGGAEILKGRLPMVQSRVSSTPVDPGRGVGLLLLQQVR